MTKLNKTDIRLLQILNWYPSGLSRAMLVKISGFARTTIYDSLIRLELENKIESYSKKRKTRGHPKTIWRKNPN
ncbi:MAG: hypothetical protein ACW990_00260 [Promethearchaeota archaeon]|jgi:hypothetical protein